MPRGCICRACKCRACRASYLTESRCVCWCHTCHFYLYSMWGDPAGLDRKLLCTRFSEWLSFLHTLHLENISHSRRKGRFEGTPWKLRFLELGEAQDHDDGSSSHWSSHLWADTRCLSRPSMPDTVIACLTWFISAFCNWQLELPQCSSSCSVSYKLQIKLSL